MPNNWRIGCCFLKTKTVPFDFGACQRAQKSRCLKDLQYEAAKHLTGRLRQITLFTISVDQKVDSTGGERRCKDFSYWRRKTQTQNLKLKGILLDELSSKEEESSGSKSKN